GSKAMPIAREILKLEGSSVLVMEDFGNSSLLDAYKTFPLPLPDFIGKAQLLAEAVKEIHDRGITHSLLHPGAILYSSKTNELKITDFESASLLTDEFNGYINLNHYDRSLQYIAPEQSGRMNRSVDSRSNLYSLGAIFYEMLTGEVMFDSDDIIEVIHSHIARQALPPSQLNNQVPKVLDRIILKLLAKNSEDRYQSAAGLIADLNVCASQLAKTGRIDDFEIGEDDHIQKLTFPQKLYGRDEEVRLLLDNYHKAASGEFAITLVGGYSGIGKSALVNEVHKPILKDRGLFVSGKYDQLKKNLPYSALLDALNELISKVLSESEDVVFNWRRKVLAALNGNGKILIDVLPELRSLIGVQPELSHLAVAEAQNRFKDTLGAFICCFASQEHPLTLFIDDLQWADAATIRFIDRLAEDDNNGYLFFIGAYRDNEVDGSHPLTIAMQDLKEKEVEVQKLTLAPLDLADLQLFLADTLKSDVSETKELAVLIDRKTGSNPFFVKSFVQRLADGHLIYYDKEQNEWQWNIQDVRQAQITENLVELLSERIGTIPQESQEVLTLAACLGNQFSLSTLASIVGKSPTETAKLLWVSMSNNFIFPLDEHYKLAEIESAGVYKETRYRFSHDRVQQAAYSLMNESQSKTVHLNIARKLVELYQGTLLEDRLFELVNHYNQALDLVQDEKELELIKRLNLKGAAKAKEAVAYQVALQLYRISTSLFSKNSWDVDYDETVEAFLSLAECEYMSGNYDEAENLYRLIEKKVKDPKHHHQLFDIQLRQYSQQARNKETLEFGAKVLAEYGVKFLAEPSLLQVAPELIRSKLMLAGKNIAAFEHAPTMTNEAALNAMNTLLNISATAYVYDANTMVLLVNKMTQLSIKYGNAPETAFGYGLFGFIEGAALGNFENSKAFSELAQKLIENSNDPIVIGKVKFLKCFATQHWYEPVKETFPLLREAYQLLVNNGSYVFASYSLFTMSSKELYLGMPIPEVYKNAVEYSNFVHRIGEGYSEKLLLVLRRFMTALSGYSHPDYEKLDVLAFDENKLIASLEQNRLLMALSWHYVYKEAEQYLFGDSRSAVVTMRKANMIDQGAPTTMPQIEHHLFKVLILSSELRNLSGLKRLRNSAGLRLSLRQLGKWAEAQPDNFRSRYLLAKAEWSTVTEPNSAEDHFLEAIEEASQNEHLMIEAMANEHLGMWCLKQNDHQKGAKFLQQAEAVWTNFGAHRKAEHLRELHPQMFTDVSGDRGMADRSMSELIDMESVLRSSQAISGEIVLGNLLKKLLKILMENLGAQRGFLLLNRDDQLTIEAELGVSGEPQMLQSEDLNGTNKLSAAVVNVTLRTAKNLILEDAQTDERWNNDPYLKSQKVRSVLCVPVSRQNKVVAVAYFENNLASGIFNSNRVNLATMLASQAAISIQNAMLYDNMEMLVKERTVELEEEMKKSDDLLLNILPAQIADELKKNGRSVARSYDNVTVLFTDFVDFTEMSQQLSPQELIDELHVCFKAFDEITTKHKVEKIKTVGDAYIAVAGLPAPNAKHAESIINVALEVREFMLNRKKEIGDRTFNVRIGVHSGGVISGIVGVKKFAFDIWGDAVNTAARMEQNSEPMKINVSESTYELTKDKFQFTSRGKIVAKGKGELEMYFVEGK
ncbi:MAG: AAA family ATPase, partial [Flavobacteriales bacterium]|nr:AAA family ATPase [Flavobacteriales bacterium]